MKKKRHDPIPLFRSAGKLKTIKRSGWIKKAGIVKNTESVADHSFRMAVLGAYLSELKKLDSSKVMRMCLFHDLAESEIGDLMPEEKASDDEHRKMEDEAIKRIFEGLPSRIKKKFLNEWNELLENRTEEAKLVWRIDKLEMGLQMKDYLTQGTKQEKLAEFNPSRLLSSELDRILKSYY